MKKVFLIILLFFLLLPAYTFPQEKQQKNEIPYVDRTDFLDIIGLRKKTKIQEPAKKGEFMIMAVPLAAYNPALGALFGFGGSLGVYFGNPKTTNISSFNATLIYTTKKQFLTFIKSTLITEEKKWELLGDWRLFIFSQSTYGLGTNKNPPVTEGFHFEGIETDTINGTQPMKFDYIRFYQTFFRQIKDYFYTGIGFHLDYHYNIEDQRLNLTANPQKITSHYAYSKYYGFDTAKYTTCGLSLNALYESRDHTINPYKGIFLQLTYRYNPKFLGSNKNSSAFYGEFRTYLSLSKKMPRHLIAFWVIANILTSGDLPYLDLPAIGYDMRGKSGRGYVQGRFRGQGWTYGEVEYRFPITNNGFIGGVIFLNAATTSRKEAIDVSKGINEPGLPLFKSIKPAGGFGLRLMTNKNARMNLEIDIGIGPNGSKGLYLAVGEAF